MKGLLDRYDSLNPEGEGEVVTTGAECKIDEYVTPAHTCSACPEGHHNDAGDNKLLLPN